MSAEHPMERMGLQEIQAAQGGRVSKEREGSQVSVLSGWGTGTAILEAMV